MMEKQKCLECNEPFAGRVDKKFCSDYCRNTHNNKVNKDSKNLIRNVNNRLRKNWRILEELNPNGKCKISKQRMDAKVLILIFSPIYIPQKQVMFIISVTIKVT